MTHWRDEAEPSRRSIAELSGDTVVPLARTMSLLAEIEREAGSWKEGYGISLLALGRLETALESDQPSRRPARSG